MRRNIWILITFLSSVTALAAVELDCGTASQEECESSPYEMVSATCDNGKKISTDEVTMKCDGGVNTEIVFKRQNGRLWDVDYAFLTGKILKCEGNEWEVLEVDTIKTNYGSITTIIRQTFSGLIKECSGRGLITIRNPIAGQGI